MVDEIRFRIRRGGGADDTEERYQTYTLRPRPRMTVLDALVAIQNEQDPSLGYRYSCRVGMCGTCALRVNGRARWACRTRLDALGGSVTLEPLTNFPVLRDLAVDMTPFFDKMKRARAWAEPSEAASSEPARIPPVSRERARVEPHRLIHCGDHVLRPDRVLRRIGRLFVAGAVNLTTLNSAASQDD